MGPLDFVKLSHLMQISSGRPEIAIGLVDGPINKSHPYLAYEHVHEISRKKSGSCRFTNSPACTHGTFVAGMLFSKKGSPSLSICPDCTLFVHPIFSEETTGDGRMPGASSDELADAITDCVEAGAQVINLSAALVRGLGSDLGKLDEALSYAAIRGVFVVAAAGNQGTVGSTAITRHPWVIPVAACDLQGRPLDDTNLGKTIAQHGLSAPGSRITSIGAGELVTLSGTSAAAPFVTGAIALLWSVFPNAAPAEIKYAVLQSAVRARVNIVPPLLNAWGAYQIMAEIELARQTPRSQKPYH